MPERCKQRIISVTGAHSGVGKTSLCGIILENTRNFGAIKFTRTELYTQVTADDDLILQKEKDTYVLSKSGAKKVVWIQSPSEGLDDALDIAFAKMKGLDGVVVEGNSPAEIIAPDLIIFVIGPDGDIKPSARDIASRADVIVINIRHGNAKESALCEGHCFREGTRKFVVDLDKRTGEIDKFVSYIKQYT